MTAERDAVVEAMARALNRVHWDGTGCGTTGNSGCVYCFGPSPMTASEVARAAYDAGLPLIVGPLRDLLKRELGDYWASGGGGAAVVCIDDVEAILDALPGGDA